MTPQPIMAEHLQKKSEIVPVSRVEGEQKKLSVIHNSMSECHKPTLREKKKGEGEHLVMLATKSEIREVRNNPKQVLFVLVYKDILISANDMTSLPSVVSHLLQDYGDVFLEETLAGLPPIRGIEHQLISFQGLHYLIDHHIEPTQKKQRRYRGKCKNFLIKVLFMKV